MIREFDFARDYDATIRLWQTAGRGIHLGPSDTPEEIQKKLARDPDLFLVAEEDSALIGTVLGGFDGRRGLVYHLAVAREQRSRGTGAALMNELESRLTAKGCHKCYLLVADDNLDAVDYYRERGWEKMNVQVMGKVLR